MVRRALDNTFPASDWEGVLWDSDFSSLSGVVVAPQNIVEQPDEIMELWNPASDWEGVLRIHLLADWNLLINSCFCSVAVRGRCCWGRRAFQS